MAVEKEPNKLSPYYLLTRTFLYLSKREYALSIKKLAPRVTGNVVDVGAGYSPYRPFFQTERYVGIDSNRQRQPEIVADVHRLPLQSHLFDSAICTEVLEHAEFPEIVMDELVRVLKEQGNLLVTVPMSWGLHYEPHDYRRYTRYGLVQLLEQHGFEVVALEKIGGLFSLIGSRLIDGITSELYQRIRMPYKIKHALLLIFSIPATVMFLLLSVSLDRFFPRDCIGWAAVARLRASL